MGSGSLGPARAPPELLKGKPDQHSDTCERGRWGPPAPPPGEGALGRLCRGRVSGPPFSAVTPFAGTSDGAARPRESYLFFLISLEGH